MSEENQFALLKKRRFGPFFLTQSLGAFNDNVFKQALVVLVVFQGSLLTNDISPDVLTSAAAGIFILPFFLFSATAGQIADKYEKSMQIRWIKVFEILIMVTASIGFVTQSLPLLLVVLFATGTQSAFFGPIKYAILPQHLNSRELIGGNGLVESGTFLAILLGTIVGGSVVVAGNGIMLVSIIVIGTASLGFVASRSIPKAEPIDPNLKINWNPLTETWRNLRFLKTNRTVFLSILGISWFWFFGANFLTHVPNYSRIVLGGTAGVSVALLALFSIGIGLGSLLCERLSGRRVELGLVPFGSIGLTIFAIDLYFASPSIPAAEPMAVTAFLSSGVGWHIAFDLIMIGVFGGFYIVPLYALIQERSEPAHRSRVIAGNNILNSAFMAAGAVLAGVLLTHWLTIPQLFLLTGVLNALVAIYIFTLVPEFLMRFVIWLLISCIYKVRPEGLDKLPESGPCIVAANHVSFVDPLIIGGYVRRPVRFVMYHKIFKVPVLNFVFRTARAIPIAPAKEDPELLEKAYDDIDQALADGDIVTIFPEGSLTHDGNIQEFKSGIERILDRRPVDVYPVALQGLWGSLFSRRDGPTVWSRRPRKLLARIGLVVGDAIAAAQVTAANLREQVADLRGDKQ